MKPIHLYRIGSDPEFVFAKVVEWQHYVIPADSVITKNKAAALQSFIGVDGHAATAEFRPPPAHNVGRHLRDVAAAVDATAEYLKKRQEMMPVALPWVGNEPLGGHIHLSMFIDEPLHKLAWESNYVSAFGKLNAVDPNVPVGNVDAVKIEEYHKLCAKGEIPSPDTICLALNYLMLPFEAWIQPWAARRKRNSKYGEAISTQIRWMVSKRPNMPVYDKAGYMHVEYRTPSTWLTHPWVAYVYLSLAKLVMLNLPIVYETAYKGAHVGKDTLAERTHIWSANPANDECRKMFRTRFEALAPSMKFTNDIRDLAKAVNYCEKNRKLWFDPYRGIDTDAWKELL